MSSDSEDVAPLINRVRKLAGNKAHPITVDTESDDSLPSWIKNYETPGSQRPLQDSSDSDSGKHSRRKPTGHVVTAVIARTAVNVDGPQGREPLEPAERDAGAAAATHATEAPTPTPASAKAAANALLTPNELQVMLPEKLPRNKLLVELEPDNTGATDLTGDAGAVGRLMVSGEQHREDIRVDLKGVIYQASVIQLAGTVCIVNAPGSGSDAKVESIFSDMLQLRRHACNDRARQEQGILDALMLDDDEDGVQAGPAAAAAAAAAVGSGEGQQDGAKDCGAKATKPKKSSAKAAAQPATKRKVKKPLGAKGGTVKKQRKQ